MMSAEGLRMFKHVSSLLSPFRSLIQRPEPASPTSRSLLLFRLENSSFLSELLGKAGMGHLLVRLSMIFSRAIRPEDPVQLVAQGLFAVVLTDRSDREAMLVARRLQRQAQVPIPVSGHDVCPVVTGILVHDEGPRLAERGALVRNARLRLEALQSEDLGLVHLFAFDDALGQSSQVSTVGEAAECGQLIAHFQPQISCHSGAVSGFELLARWNHPSRGTLLPGAFLSSMTESDHSALTLAMLDQGLRALQEWDAAGLDVPTISINISNCELSDPNFAACILWELDRHELRPHRLTIEVLESVGPITSNAEARRNLRLLAEAGCRIDLDDFGTGYASLDAIRQFGVHRIKIDRSFVTACDVDDSQQRMILAVLALAERLGISALAEGVETREELGFLAQMGCDEVQGYAIARPMPFDAATDFLRRRAAEAASSETLEIDRLLRRGTA